jgi:iron complex outermembrane receptor protein
MSQGRWMGAVRSRTLIQSLLLSVAAATVAHAQQTDTASPPAASSATTVQEVTITAEKRVENVQDVPVSVSVMSGQALQDFQQSDLHDIMNNIPNLFVLQSGVDDVVAIRGFSSGPNNIAFDQEVSIYEDGIYGGRSAQFMAPMFDLDHIEVLRGPQGALFGKNTAAGAVNVVTAQPTDTFSAGLTLDGGVIQTGVTGWGYVSGPINDQWSFRLAAKVEDQNGFIENLATGNEDPHTAQQLGRLTVRFRPNDTFDATAMVEYTNMKVTGGINVAGPVGMITDPVDYRYVQDPYIDGQSEENGVTSLNSAVTLNWHLGGDFTLTSITGYSQFSTTRFSAYDQDNPGDGIVAPTFANAFPEKFHQESEEVRLVSPSGKRFEYVVGVYADNSDYHLHQVDYYNLPAIGLAGAQSSDFQQWAQSASVYGQGTYHVLDKLRVVGGLRFTYDHKIGDFVGSPAYQGESLQPISSASGSINETFVDPSVSVQYDIAPRVMLYATYAEGSKSGAFVSNSFGTTDANFIYKPEHSTNYEVGVKSTLADGHLVADLSLYDTLFKNLQETQFDPATQSFVAGNAGGARSYGFEGSLNWKPLASLQFNASVAYLDAKFTDFKGAECLATQTVAQCNPSDFNPADPNSVANNNIAGEPLPYASKWTANFEAHHKLDITNNLRLDTTVDASVRSTYVTSDDYSPIYGMQPTYVKIDARVQIGRPDGRWAFAVVGKNLTNVLTVGDALDLPFPITPISRSMRWLDSGRSLALEVSSHF